MRKEGEKWFLEEGENLYCYCCGKECSRVWMDELLPPEERRICKQCIEKRSKLKLSIPQKEAEQQNEEFQKWCKDQNKPKEKREKLRELLRANCSFSEKVIETIVEKIIPVDEKELEKYGFPVHFCNGGVLMICIKDGVLHSTFRDIDGFVLPEKEFVKRFRK